MTNQNNSRQISVAEMAPHVHNFLPRENKVDKISAWLIDWIKASLETGKIKHSDFLPTKESLAFHIGVSKGTIQNVYRKVEDFGLICSKQKIGTYVNAIPNNKSEVKLTSKRDFAVEKIKEYILNNNLKKDDILPSIRVLAKKTNISNSTIRVAIESLIWEKILAKNKNEFFILSTDFKVNNIEHQTLVDKITKNIKKMIANKSFANNKFPTNLELANEFKVSIKTIHDAIKILSREGLLKARRGRYGTQILVANSSSNELYYYERVEIKIKHYITENCEVGMKLPSIIEFSKQFKVSAKTIKKALDNLAEEGYITFARGRNGGTFVTDIPQDGGEAYKWLAINPQFMSSNSN